VVVTDLDPAAAERVAGEIEAGGGTAQPATASRLRRPFRGGLTDRARHAIAAPVSHQQSSKVQGDET
jgi:hypothetical protein